MPTPKRTRITSEITRRLSAISTDAAPSAGAPAYHTDIGARVFYNRQRQLAPHELPAIVFMDGENPQTREVSSHTTHTLDLVLVLCAYRGADGELGAQLAHQLSADVERCLGADRRLSEGGAGERLAQDLTILGADLVTDDSSATVVICVVMNVQVVYRTKPFNPYE